MLFDSLSTTQQSALTRLHEGLTMHENLVKLMHERAQ